LAEVDVVPAEVKDPSVVCCDHGVAAIISFHRGDPGSARTHLDAAAPSAAQVGQRVVWPLSLARSLDAEYAGDRDAQRILVSVRCSEQRPLENTSADPRAAASTKQHRQALHEKSTKGEFLIKPGAN